MKSSPTDESFRLGLGTALKCRQEPYHRCLILSDPPKNGGYIVLVRITTDDGYRIQNIHEVARRFGINAAELRQVLADLGMAADDIVHSGFDLPSAQIDIMVAPEGISRRQLARPLYPKALTRLETQLTQSANEALAELPKVCNWGSKNDSKGKSHRWVGWKAHFDWADKGLPLTVVTTSASCHDSQVAIPMMRLTASKCASCYDLMDAAYDAASITQVSKELGHTPIIDRNVRRGEKIPKSDAEAAIYKQRSTAERGNSRLKDEYGLRNLRVRGHAKAHMHIMFGVLALFSDQLHKIFMC